MFDVLFLAETFPFLEVSAGAERGIHSRGKHQRPRRTLRICASDTTKTLVPRRRGELVAGGGIVLRMNGIDLFPQARQQRARYGIARRGSVELQHTDMARIRRREVRHADQRSRVPAVGRVCCSSIAAGEARLPLPLRSRAGVQAKLEGPGGT